MEIYTCSNDDHIIINPLVKDFEYLQQQNFRYDS